jgi:hypothetical protein
LVDTAEKPASWHGHQSAGQLTLGQIEMSQVRKKNVLSLRNRTAQSYAILLRGPETFAHINKMAGSGSNIVKKNICVKRKSLTSVILYC